MQIKLGYRTPTGLIVPFGYAVANEVCRPWAVFQSHSFYGWETVALYSSGILRHLLSWRWGTPFTSYTYISGFFRAALFYDAFINNSYLPALPAPGSVWVSPRVCPIENARWGVNRLVLSLSVGANKAGPRPW